MEKQFSFTQPVSFIPLDFEQQAWYIDNTQRMLNLLEEFANNNNDTVVKNIGAHSGEIVW